MTDATQMIHAGYNIYVCQLSIGAMFAVQSEDNKAAGRAGGHGDMLYSTLDAAKRQAEKQAEDAKTKHEEAIAAAAETQAEAGQQAREKAARYALHGFLDGRSEVQKHKIAAHLSKVVRYKGEVVSLREMIEGIISKGGQVTQDEDGERFLSTDPHDLDVGLTQKTISKIGMDYAQHISS